MLVLIRQNIRVQFVKQTNLGDGKFNDTEIYAVRIIKEERGLDIVEADARYVQRPYTVMFSKMLPQKVMHLQVYCRTVNCGMTLATYNCLSGITTRG